MAGADAAIMELLRKGAAQMQGWPMTQCLKNSSTAEPQRLTVSLRCCSGTKIPAPATMSDVKCAIETRRHVFTVALDSHVFLSKSFKDAMEHQFGRDSTLDGITALRALLSSPLSRPDIRR